MKKILILLLVLSVNVQVYLAVDTFPGAQGFGAKSIGGRGGKVIEVTNLNDSGLGSFRTAVTTVGPRTVVFRTGGTIIVKTNISINNPFITIAGQTAPGGGITLKNDPSNIRGPLSIRTHDVIIRYIRIRPGPSTVKSSALDGLNIPGSPSKTYNIVIDHCSVSWGVDENMPMTGAKDVTISWNIISEGLHNSSHSQGAHSRGLLIREGSTRVTAHHNLMAHHEYRNPQIGHGAGDVEIINNVSYNWIRFALNGNSTSATARCNIAILGNTFKKGLNSSISKREITMDPGGGITGTWGLYIKGNIGPYRTSDTQPDSNSVEADDVKWIVSTPPFTLSGVVTTSASQAYTDVLAKAGCRLPMQDSVDVRIINDVKNGTGKVIDNPSQVGGWPVLAAGTAPIDTDHDGMPDTWETSHALNPKDATDGPKIGADGYTNLENYLNSLAP